MINLFCIGIIILAAATCSSVGGALIKLPNIAKSDGRIVGGNEVEIINVPYIVSLQYRGFKFHICGGSILDSWTIVTAYHCVATIKPQQLEIRAGSKNNQIGGQTVVAKIIIRHENFNKYTLDNDIAIIKLVSPLIFSSTVSPIGLPSYNGGVTLPVGTEAIVAGWGLIAENDKTLQTNLRAVNVLTYDQTKCQERNGKLTERMLCAGMIAGGKDSCQGDSGGPLVHNDKLIGIVSWGYGCARAGYPGVYVNVANMLPWINRHR